MKGSPLVVLFLTVFIDLLGFGIVLPLLPYYAEGFGAGPLAVTLLSSSYSLMQFLFAPVWGRLSDRVGRRPILVLSLAGSALSYLLFGLAGSLAALFATRLLAGVCAANISTAQAYIADVTTPETRAKGMGMIGAAFGLGFIFGPAVGGALSRYGYAVPAFFAAGLSLAALALALFRLPESLRRRIDNPGGAARGGFDLGRLWAALVHPRMGLLLLIFFCSVFAFANLEATFALFVERAARFGYTARETGYLFAYMGVLMSLMQGGLVGRLARRFGERRLVAAGTLMLAAGLGVVPLAPGLGGLMGALALLAFGVGMNTPSLSSLISRSAGADEQGGVLGVSQSMSSLARILGPAWGGFAFEQFGPASPYFTTAGLMGATFLVSLMLCRQAEGG
ncbi:MAG: hypothetical protein A3F84_22745 [Candidatus Handelsmanbacteria bacterium RIFCSPLOWO2_12_FULL_64_10]|uniref:Major facilitator superfamily (MFS) profile domain-containing protein n=1 Tax=Handelsmanbacteria sp. (strain RIFCSPLOWO2_12_FULL_64_10) TaxID=1817868 RepID=A0A1F6C8N1_HANXR|nr:MAG: hypothetical protein A3F84_22745 [Candidatus Handelsmanbacteria bacterium RIFCSPLOWO2_12_FULL_64_10]